MGDACECICSFQWAMRRLVEIINQAQAYCTDDECNDGPGQNTGGTGQNPMFLMMMFAMFAMMMFAMRPKSKTERNEKQPPSGSGPGNNQPPPDIST